MVVTKGTVLSICLIPVMIFRISSSQWANPGTYGTYFVFAWPETVQGSTCVLHMMSVTNHTTTVTITIPKTQHKWNETIQPFQDISNQINQSYISMGSRVRLAYVTVKVRSNFNISVTAISHNGNSTNSTKTTNSFQVIPVASLGQEYYVPLRYKPYEGIATVSAISEETNVSITFSEHIYLSGENVSRGTIINETLKPFQTYQLAVDLSAFKYNVVIMHIKSDKVVAVVAGSICARLVPGNGTCDSLAEQFPPYNQWGQRFTVPSFLNITNYVMLVIAGRANTTVNISNEYRFMHNAGDHRIWKVTDDVEFVKSNKPVLVVLFSTSGVDEHSGDPSMSIIPPHEQFLQGRQIFNIYPIESNPNMTHYLAVTAACTSMENVTLDDNLIKHQSSKTTRRESMCVYHLEINPGNHTLVGTVPYMLMSYGFGNRVGYSNIISFNTRPITCEAHDDVKNDTVEYRCEDLEQTFCPATETKDGDEIILWPQTAIFKIHNSTSVCALTFTKAGIPVWSRRCILTDDQKGTWNDPEKHDCGDEVKVKIPHDLLTAEVTASNVEVVSSTLLNLTEEIEEISTNDVRDVANILSKIVGAGSSSKTVTESVVNTVDAILTDLSEADADEDGQFDTMDTSASTSEMVQLMEQQLQQTLEVGDSLTIIDDLIQVRAFHVDVLDDPEDVSIKPIEQQPSDTSVVLPKEIFISQETAVAVIFILYRDDALFRPPSSSLKERTGPELVLSVSVVTSTKITKLIQPVILNFPRPKNNRTISSTTACVFWDFEQNDGAGDWSEKGCVYAGATDESESVRCECDHLTNFAVLMDYTDDVAEMPVVYTAFLDVLTKIGCTVSIIGLVVTLSIFFLFKRLRTSRPRRILVHLCIALLCLYVTFLFGIDSAVNSKWACPMVAALIHYFLLCAIFWMGVEAMNIYLMLIRLFNMNVSHFVLKGAVVAWGSPLVIVGICMAASTDQYVQNGFCFLKPGNVFYIGLITPMALVLIHNTIIFCLVLRKLMNANLAGTVLDKKTEMDLLKERLQNALTMTILMGLTWSFGFLMIGHARFIFQFLFCLTNSFQGVIVFGLFCWRQEDVRKALRPHCLSIKRKGKQVVGAKSDYNDTSTFTRLQSAKVSTEVCKNMTSTCSASSTVLLSSNKSNNLGDSVSDV